MIFVPSAIDKYTLLEIQTIEMVTIHKGYILPSIENPSSEIWFFLSIVTKNAHVWRIVTNATVTDYFLTLTSPTGVRRLDRSSIDILIHPIKLTVACQAKIKNAIGTYIRNLSR